MKKTLLFILQLELGIGIIVYFLVNMYSSGKLGEFANALATGAGHLPLLVGGMSIFGVCMLLCAKRWQILLRAQGLKVSYAQTTILYFIGHFFNSLLPGSTSGDVIKAVYVARETPDKKAEAITTIVVDRLIGLAALIAITVVVMLCRLPFFMAYSETRWAMVVNFVLLAGMVGGTLVIFAQNLFERWNFFKRLEEKTAIGPLIKRSYTAFHTCVKSPSILVNTSIISVVNHLVLILSAYMIGCALGIPLGFTAYLTVFPIINAIAGLPITPGGIGTRDVATIFLLGVMNVAQPVALSLSLLIYLMPVLWSLLCGVVYMFYLVKYNVPRDK